MRNFLYTLCIAIVFLVTAQAQSTAQVVGCLSRAPNGTLQFRASESGRVFTIHGDVNLLQHYVNHLVAVPQSLLGNNRPLSARSVRDVADTCTATPSTAQAGSVAGKAGLVQTAPPVTSAAVVDETTAGFQTEAGASQERGASARKPLKRQPGAITPLRPGQAGQTQLQADTNAEAAARAEMYPGMTLGVDLKAAPASSITSTQEANQHLQPSKQNTPNH